MFVCLTCTYPSRRETCDNPGCVANPDVTEAQKEQWKDEIDRRHAEETERERLRKIRRRATGRRDGKILLERASQATGPDLVCWEHQANREGLR